MYKRDVVMFDLVSLTVGISGRSYYGLRKLFVLLCLLLL